ncbi:MAG: KamA family radical SAM protein [Planctomycetaceae bacterium]|jgi:EF-P beta-lysylation protein EpmB|nr:KamA family radical SAM protein [Planctomycetaceae bacterium]
MSDWKAELNDCITDVSELFRLLEMEPEVLPRCPSGSSGYPLLIPRSLLDRIEKGNPNDPVLRQFLPQEAETLSVQGFTDDPVGEAGKEQRVNQLPVLNKYTGRSLLLTTNSCAVNCRFCFRRHSRKKQLSVIHYPLSITVPLHCSEVILSGGDPLILEDTEVQTLVNYIRKFPNVKRLRIHTRLPVILPKRMTEKLVGVLDTRRQAAGLNAVYLVFHINHPNELTGEFFERIQTLQNTVLMSQTVLLKGVNDDADVLVQLFETLANHRIIPYYLHQLDKVAGAAHFEVPISRGRELLAEIAGRLPGYAVPKYVQEVAGEKSKIVL